MKLWIDDIRDAPDESWTEIRKVQKAISALAYFYPSITEISLDHDIENRPDDETFKPVAHYIGLRFKYTAQGEHPKIRVHSDNPIGGKELVDIMGHYGVKSTYEPFTSEADFKKKYELE